MAHVEYYLCDRCGTKVESRTQVGRFCLRLWCDIFCIEESFCDEGDYCEACIRALQDTLKDVVRDWLDVK